MIDMMSFDYRKHAARLIVIFAAAAILNILPVFITGVPLDKQLSSDAEYHVVHWQEFSKSYSGNFQKDDMFRLDTRPAGDLLFDKILVAVGEFLKQRVDRWSVIVSALALALFLGAVYFVVSYSLQSPTTGFIVGLGSIVPTFALGGASWGFLTQGFVPKELAMSMAIWLLLLYFYGIRNRSPWHIRTVFLVSGVLSNWYPVLFFHYALMLGLAETIRLKTLNKEHLFYALFYFVGAPLALWDIFRKSQETSSLDLEILRSRFGYMMLSSWQYAILHYLRRFIIYLFILPGLYFIAKRRLAESEKSELSPWYAIAISAATISILGLLLENFSPLTKFLFSRTSIWFLFASMVVVVVALQKIFSKKMGLVTGMTLLIFLGQSAIPSIYRQLRNDYTNAENYRRYLAVLTKLQDLVPSQEIILANPKDANKIRAYGNRGVYVAWKDGGISLLDGKGGAEWLKRMRETTEIFDKKDFGLFKKFAEEKNLNYLLYQDGDIEIGKSELEKNTIFKLAPFGITKIF